MKVSEAIQWARQLKQINTTHYPDALLLQFLNECEGKVQTEFLRIADTDVQRYSELDMDKDLIVGPPHDKLYYTYICAMIDFANGEYAKYNNAIIIANSFLSEWAAWFNRTHRRNGREYLGVFLSAYAIALKWGFEGTEEEWLASLVGPQGPHGASLVSVEQTEESTEDGGRNVVSLRYGNGPEDYSDIYIRNGRTGPVGPPGRDGKDGQDGSPGKDGRDGSPGRDGEDGRDGSPGIDGKDGVSPTVTVTTIAGGHRVTITDANGTKYFDVKDGKDGSGGTGGGADGEDGFSPVVTITQIEGGHRVAIEDQYGTQSFDVMDGAEGPAGPAGQDGSPGSPGKDGQDGPVGPGVASGGTTGQVLVKKSDEDHDTEWQDAPTSLPAGGATGQVLAKTSEADGDAEWVDVPDAGYDMVIVSDVYDLAAEGVGPSNFSVESGTMQDLVDKAADGKDCRVLLKFSGKPYGTGWTKTWEAVHTSNSTNQQVWFQFVDNGGYFYLAGYGGVSIPYNSFSDFAYIPFAPSEVSADAVKFSDGETFQQKLEQGDLTGPAGEDGKTPVKGTDYWTTADRQQMVSDVLAALPAAEGVSV